MEQSNDEILSGQTDAHTERMGIHKADVSQVADLKKVLDIHATNNASEFKDIKTDLKQLMPLSELIDPIKQIVEDKQTDLLVQKKIGKIVGIITKIVVFIGVFIGSLFAIIQLMFRLKE